MEPFEGAFLEQLLAQSIAADAVGLSKEELLSSSFSVREDLAAFLQQDEHLRYSMMVADGMREVLQLCAETVVGFSGITWGAGYLVDQESGGMDLIAEVNVPDTVLPLIEHYQPDAHMSQHVRAGHPLHLVRTGQESMSDVAFMSVLPILHNGKPAACLTVASHSKNMLPPRTRHLLEGISDYAGIVIARILAEDKIKKMKESEQETLTALINSLKTPLAIMHGYIDLLLSGSEGDDRPMKCDQVLRKVMAQSARVSTLITELLDLEEISADAPLSDCDVFSIGEIVAQIVERVERENDRRIVLEIAEEEALVEGGHAWISRAIEHLIVNAIRFSSSPVLVQIRGTEGNVIVDVVDQGCGISPEELPHIFERFYHASYLPDGRPNPGIGLGLTLAKGIITSFQGSIRATSTVDQGSRFTILLPRAFNT